MLYFWHGADFDVKCEVYISTHLLLIYIYPTLKPSCIDRREYFTPHYQFGTKIFAPGAEFEHFCENRCNYTFVLIYCSYYFLLMLKPGFILVYVDNVYTITNLEPKICNRSLI